MFFGGERIVVCYMIVEDPDEEREALAKLLPIQRGDFAALFRVMGERPVTIRTLDPPLHQFVPHDEAGQKESRTRPAPRSRRSPPVARCTRTIPCSVRG